MAVSWALTLTVQRSSGSIELWSLVRGEATSLMPGVDLPHFCRVGGREHYRMGSTQGRPMAPDGPLRRGHDTWDPVVAHPALVESCPSRDCWTADVVIGSRLYAAAEYILTNDSLTRRSRGKSQSIPLADLTQVSGYFRNNAGDFIALQSREEGFDLQLGTPDVDQLLARLGPLLVELGIDRTVIADEKTRRWLGLPGGGLRDPWQPPSKDA